MRKQELGHGRDRRHRGRTESEPGVVEVCELDVGGARFWVQRDPDVSPACSPVGMALVVDGPTPLT